MFTDNRLKHIGLQFFADPPADPPPTDPPAEPPADPPVGKTFTQEEVTRMLANEKRQGRYSVLRELGIDPEAKDGIKNAKKTLDDQKTQKQLDDEALNTEKEAKIKAEQRATIAEQKLAALSAGCKREFVDEVTALAAIKMDDKTDFDAAVSAIKEKMPNLFEDDGTDTGSGGTGQGQGHRRKDNTQKPGSFGQRLAQGAKEANPKDNPYFKN